MGDRVGDLGPKHAVRLSDLRDRHILTAVCPACRHQARVRMWRLKLGRDERVTSLLDVRERLRCLRCGNRRLNRIYVEVAEPGPE